MQLVVVVVGRDSRKLHRFVTMTAGVMFSIAARVTRIIGVIMSVVAKCAGEMTKMYVTALTSVRTWEWHVTALSIGLCSLLIRFWRME